MNIDAYLERIGLDYRPPPTLAGLTAVHRAHLFAVPYENLDVQLGRTVGLAVPAIFDKIVTRRRGGWCYEMNGVLGWALGQLGFRVTRATGAVMREMFADPTHGNHLVLRVDMGEGVWLADAGFGDGPVDPIRVVEGEFSANGFTFKLTHESDGWWRMHNLPGIGAKSFDFNLAPADEAMLQERCTFLQTAPASNFVLNFTAQRCVPHGLVIIRGRTFRRVRPDGQEERLIASAEDFVETLRGEFGIVDPEAATIWPKVVARHEQLFGPAA